MNVIFLNNACKLISKRIKRRTCVIIFGETALHCSILVWFLVKHISKRRMTHKFLFLFDKSLMVMTKIYLLVYLVAKIRTYQRPK